MNAVKLDAEARDVEHGSLLDVVLQLSLLLETFVLLSFPHFPLDTGQLPTTPHSMDLNRFFQLQKRMTWKQSCRNFPSR